MISNSRASTPAGFTLLEVLAALVIVGASVVALYYRGTESLEDAREAFLLGKGILLAESVVNEMCVFGYPYYAGGEYHGRGEEEGFTVEAEFTAEEVSLGERESGGTAVEGHPPDTGKERKTTVILRLAAAVTLPDDPSFSVGLERTMPAEESGVAGYEAALPEGTGGGR